MKRSILFTNDLIVSKKARKVINRAKARKFSENRAMITKRRKKSHPDLAFAHSMGALMNDNGGRFRKFCEIMTLKESGQPYVLVARGGNKPKSHQVQRAKVN